ncbi:MAG: hypothetical protein UC961_02755 [Emergencia sp.]|nr:hypothetical protein [Emergencia sp.]
MKSLTDRDCRCSIKGRKGTAFQKLYMGEMARLFSAHLQGKELSEQEWLQGFLESVEV